MSRVNPTLINDQITNEETLLKKNDRVKIGDTTFLFSEQEAPESTIPVKKGKKSKGGYDDIFGDIETPELPPQPEPIEADLEAKIPEEPIKEQEFPPTAYDTIFEDIGEAPELPFNLLSESPLVLKVIGGPNAGAEIGLEKGKSYTIGKDSNTCDIVFQDLSVSRNHARLSISPEGILELEDLGSKNGTMVNNAPMPEKRAITSQDTISMGTTIFLILDREAAQETIYAPRMPVYEEKAPAPAIETKAEEKPARDWKTQKIPGKHLIFAGSFLMIFLIMFLSFFSLFKSEQIEVSFKEPQEHIQEALAKFTGVHYSYNPASGKLFLAGHVLTAIDYQEMRYNLSLIDAIMNTEDNVVIDEYVWKTMTDVLTANAGWRGVTITSPEPGQFLVHGYVQTIEQAALLADYMNVNFPYPDRLQNKVVVEDNLNIQIQSLLQARGFSAVSFQLSAGDLVLVGRYSDKLEKEYQEIISELNKLDGIQGIKNFAIASSALAGQHRSDTTI